MKKKTSKQSLSSFKYMIVLLFTLFNNAFRSISLLAQSDSLNNYLIVAAKSNPEIKATYDRYLISLEMVPQVGYLPDPEATFGYFIKPVLQMMGNQVADIRIMQMFPWFGTRSAAKKEAAEMAKARFEEFEDARNGLFFEITSQYYLLYQLEKEQELAEQNLRYLKTFEQLSLTRFQTGYNKTSGSGAVSKSILSTGNRGQANGGGSSGSGNMQSPTGNSNQNNMSAGSQGSPMNVVPQGNGMVEVLSIRMDILDLQNQVASLAEKKGSEMASFNSLLNRPSQTTVFLPDSLEEKQFIMDTSKIYDSIYHSNSIINMYLNEQAAYEAEIKKTKRMGLPMFGIGVDYMVLTPLSGPDFKGNGNDMVMPMLTLTLPIYRKKYSSMKREAGFKLEETKENQQSMANKLNTTLQNILLDLHDAERKINQFLIVENLLHESLAIVMTDYQTGGTNFEDVISIQQKLIQNEFNLTESVVKSRIAIANLNYLLSQKLVINEP